MPQLTNSFVRLHGAAEEFLHWSRYGWAVPRRWRYIANPILTYFFSRILTEFFVTLLCQGLCRIRSSPASQRRSSRSMLWNNAWWARCAPRKARESLHLQMPASARSCAVSFITPQASLLREASFTKVASSQADTRVRQAFEHHSPGYAQSHTTPAGAFTVSHRQHGNSRAAELGHIAGQWPLPSATHCCPLAQITTACPKRSGWA